MNQNTLDTLSLKLLAIAEAMEQRDARAREQMMRQSADLGHAARQVTAGGQQFAQEALQAIAREARGAVDAGIDVAAQRCRGQLDAAAEGAARAAAEARDAARALGRQRGLWTWTLPLALIVGSVLAAGGSSFVVWQKMGELKRAEFAQDILDATSSGRLTRCDGRLCARVGAQPARFGAQDEYLLLEE